MADFVIPDKPEFNPSMEQFKTTDPAHADLFNAKTAQLLENEAYLKNRMVQVIVSSTEPTDVPALWFCTPTESTPNDGVVLSLAENGDSSLIAEVSKKNYAVLNAKSESNNQYTIIM